VNGQFIASISRGRKLWEVIVYSLVVPVLYGLVWFCVWGGAGLRQSRQAAEMEVLGETYFNNSAHFSVPGNEFCYDVPQEDILVDNAVVFTNHLPGVTPVCKFNEEDSNSAAFNVMNAFSFPSNFSNGGYGSGLSLIFMLACAIFFMAGAGSASLIVDKMASSGRKNNHLARRMFWLVTVGALTTALLSTGGEDALTVLQAAMIVCGLPSAILLCYMLQSLTLMCQQAETFHGEAEYRTPDQPEFPMPIYGGIFNVFEYCASWGKVNQARVDLGMHEVTSAQALEFATGLAIPFVSLRRVLAVVYPLNCKTNMALVCGYGIVYACFVILWIASASVHGLVALAWTAFLGHGILLASIRTQFRAHYNIRSNSIGDLMASALFWPIVHSQMRLHCMAVGGKCGAQDVAVKDPPSRKDTGGELEM
jgi:BCCT, betaine/carnitine/choline family transporter